MSKTLSEFFDMQGENQRVMLKNGMYDGFVKENVAEMFAAELPVDSPKLASYHVQQLMSEIGEVLDADKRWKNIRNEKYDRPAKVEELADCFIVLMNICMFSDVTAEEFEEAIMRKVEKVRTRIDIMQKIVKVSGDTDNVNACTCNETNTCNCVDGACMIEL